VDLGLIIMIILALVVVAAGVEAYLKRNRHRNISANRPDAPEPDHVPLGTEALDHALVRKVRQENRRLTDLNDDHSRRYHSARADKD